MAKKLLINAIHPEECRVAITENERLLELDIEWADQVPLKGNIYKAQITRIEPSLQAAFLDIGSTRNGFLQINDIHPAYFRKRFEQDPRRRPLRPPIQDVLEAHQELVVQVVKDEREAKGATLTTNLSIPGRYLVLMVGNQRGGVSRKIIDASQRRKLREAVDDLRIPAGMGVIVRTAGINKTSAELQRDLDSLLDLWNDMVAHSFDSGTPQLLYKESDLAIRTIRDYLTADIDEILIDEIETFQHAKRFVDKVMPTFSSKVHFYDEPQPLFSKFLLDSQIEATNQPEVTLHSGGSIVINVTEAIVAIDVNSGRATTQSDVEETAFATNLEAADEVARQLRLRDLGGLVVIDFIDMFDKRHKALVEKRLRDAVKYDKAKVEAGKISKFGLLEMSRQRLKSSLVSQSHTTCPQCEGRGKIKTPETTALEALRKIQSSAFAGGFSAIRVRMAPAAALFLLNNKRQALSKLENDCGVQILVYADGRLKSEQYALELANDKATIRHLTERPSKPQTEGTPEAASSGSRQYQGRSRKRSGRSRGRNQSRNRGGRYSRGPDRPGYGHQGQEHQSRDSSSLERGNNQPANNDQPAAPPRSESSREVE